MHLKLHRTCAHHVCADLCLLGKLCIFSVCDLQVSLVPVTICQISSKFLLTSFLPSELCSKRQTIHLRSVSVSIFKGAVVVSLACVFDWSFQASHSGSTSWNTVQMHFRNEHKRGLIVSKKKQKQIAQFGFHICCSSSAKHMFVLHSFGSSHTSSIPEKKIQR